MYWHERISAKEPEYDCNVVDIAYRIQCACLPSDHAHDLMQAIAQELPWFDEEETVGIHTIHGAGSGNGWYRPNQGGDEVLHLSRRVRLILRVPLNRAQQCTALCGKVLKVSEYDLVVASYKLRAIQPSPIVRIG